MKRVAEANKMINNLFDHNQTFAWLITSKLAYMK